MRAVIAVMTRIPRAGYTKTRLMTKMSGYECAVFHLACLVDTCTAIMNSGLAGQIYYTGGEASCLLGQHLFEKKPPWGLRPDDFNYFKVLPQEGNDLGERLCQAATNALSHYEGVLLLGSDMPDLSPQLLLTACQRLNENDIVIGPAEDGGYYLLGIKNVYPELFNNIPWGTSGVFEATMEIVIKKGLSFSLLEERADIDTWKDLCDFYQENRELDESKKMNAYSYAKTMIQKYGL